MDKEMKFLSNVKGVKYKVEDLSRRVDSLSDSVNDKVKLKAMIFKASALLEYIVSTFSSSFLSAEQSRLDNKSLSEAEELVAEIQMELDNLGASTPTVLNVNVDEATSIVGALLLELHKAGITDMATKKEEELYKLVKFLREQSYTMPVFSVHDGYLIQFNIVIAWDNAFITIEKVTKEGQVQ